METSNRIATEILSLKGEDRQRARILLQEFNKDRKKQDWSEFATYLSLGTALGMSTTMCVGTYIGLIASITTHNPAFVGVASGIGLSCGLSIGAGAGSLAYALKDGIVRQDRLETLRNNVRAFSKQHPS